MPDPQRKQPVWEYAERSCGGGQSPISQLTQAGLEGWEFIYMQSHGSPGQTNPTASLFFKRRAQS